MHVIYSISILLLGLLIFYFYWIRRERRDNKRDLFKQNETYDFEFSNELALTVKNSNTAYAYWNSDKLKTEEEKLVFQLYDMTAEEKIKLSFIVNPKQEELFIQLPDSDHFYYAKLGFYNDDNNFVPIAVSEAIAPPTTTLSKESSGIWLELQEDKKIYSYEDYDYLSRKSPFKTTSSKEFNKHNQ